MGNSLLELCYAAEMQIGMIFVSLMDSPLPALSFHASSLGTWGLSLSKGTIFSFFCVSNLLKRPPHIPWCQSLLKVIQILLSVTRVQLPLTSRGTSPIYGNRGVSRGFITYSKHNFQVVQSHVKTSKQDVYPPSCCRIVTCSKNSVHRSLSSYPAAV